VLGGAAYGLLLGSAGHVAGWPVAKGGSQKIADALKQYFISLGGEVRTGVEIHSLDELPKAKAMLMDITPKQTINNCWRFVTDKLPAPTE